MDCTRAARAAILRHRVSPKDRKTLELLVLPSFDYCPDFPEGLGEDVIASRKLLTGGVVLAALAVFGCGQDDERTPVHGRVFYRGQPLSGGTIVFTPDLERGGRGPLACGEIDAEGRYSLRTGDKLGAVSGWHRVTIAPPSLAVAPGQPIPPPSIDLPRKYRDPEQSGLLREVQPGKTGEQDFHLE